MFKLKAIFSCILKIEEIRRQSIVSFTWSIVLLIIGLLSTVYFAHIVGASLQGAYFLFTAYYGIAALLSDGGFDLILKLDSKIYDELKGIVTQMNLPWPDRL